MPSILHLLHKIIMPGQSEVVVHFYYWKNRKHWSLLGDLVCQNTGPNSKPICTIVLEELLLLFYSGPQNLYWWWCMLVEGFFFVVTLLLSHLLCFYHDVCGNPHSGPPPSFWSCLLSFAGALEFFLCLPTICCCCCCCTGNSVIWNQRNRGCCLLLATVTNTKWRIPWMHKEHEELIG